MKKLILAAAGGALVLVGALVAQSIYVPDSGTQLVETMSATDPAPASAGACLFSVKTLNYTTGHEWACVGAPGAQVWTDLTSLDNPASNPPASSSAPGTTGNLTWDQNYIYICVGPSTWKRAALSTF